MCFALMAGCSDDNGDGEIVGDWNAVSLAANDVSTTCPGVVLVNDEFSLVCSSQTTSFMSDGSFITVRTTDELENPEDSRREGIWSTNGDELTMAITREGPDADNLQVLNPAETYLLQGSVSGNTLMRSCSSDFGTVTSAYARL